MMKRVMMAGACVVLASMMAATASIAAGHAGKLAHGRTGQGRNIRVRVFPDQIKIQSFSIELNCSGGYVLVDEESNFLPSAVSKKGQIHDAQVGSTDEILIRGRLTGHKVSGRIRVRDRLGKHRCSSPWVRFTAHD
jgi:hypothetical protein